jgi:hypothetical protein
MSDFQNRIISKKNYSKIPNEVYKGEDHTRTGDIKIEKV